MFEKFDPDFYQVVPFADNMGLTTTQATNVEDNGDGTFSYDMGPSSADFSTDKLLDVFRRTAQLMSAEDLAEIRADLSDAVVLLEKVEAKGIKTFTLNDSSGVFTQIAKLTL